MSILSQTLLMFITLVITPGWAVHHIICRWWSGVLQLLGFLKLIRNYRAASPDKQPIFPCQSCFGQQAEIRQVRPLCSLHILPIRRFRPAKCRLLIFELRSLTTGSASAWKQCPEKTRDTLQQHQPDAAHGRRAHWSSSPMHTPLR